MYINGKKVTLEQLKAIAEKLIGKMIDDMYDDMVERGIEALSIEEEERQILLNNMLTHYINVEEYEKCAHIRDLINSK